MKHLPIDPQFAAAFLGVQTSLKNGEPRLVDGEPIVDVTCVVFDPDNPKQSENLTVRVPQSGIQKGLEPFFMVQFRRLVARPWAFEGRSGLTFSAEAVTKAVPTAEAKS